MTPEEYEKELTKLEDEFDDKKITLDEKYALSNNIVKIDDFVIDRIGTIKVEKIKIGVINSIVPYCTYLGVQITKAGKPFKHGKKRWVTQYDIKKGGE